MTPGGPSGGVPEIEQFRAHLARRFETVIQPDTEACLKLINRLIKACAPNFNGSSNDG